MRRWGPGVALSLAASVSPARAAPVAPSALPLADAPLSASPPSEVQQPPAFLPAPHRPTPVPYRLGPEDKAAPLTLGRALAQVEARPEGLDLSLVPPPPPANLAARTVVMGGVILAAVGIAGMFITPHCDLRAPGGGCRVASGTDPVFPTLLVLGLGATTTGAYWMRRDLPARD